MPFSLVNLSQQDPVWKSEKLGFSEETLGYVGCAATSVAMLLSGHGYKETPKTINEKLKSRNGFMGSYIVWGGVTNVHPQVVHRTTVRCRDVDAPLNRIDAAISFGQPVIVEVDSSPADGLQNHWVVVYAKKGDDYLMLDPWPYPAEKGKEVLLMPRYSHGRPLKRSITSAIFFECLVSGPDSVGTSAPSTTTTTTSTTPSPTEPGLYVLIPAGVDAGLRLRTQPTTASDTITIEPPGTMLRVLDPEDQALPKIGVNEQWLKVRDAQGREGFVAAWFVEKGPHVKAAETPSTTTAGTGSAGDAPGTSTSASTPAPIPDPDPQKMKVVVSQSVGAAGLRLRSQPGMGASLVDILEAGSVLTVLDAEEVARAKVGMEGKWIHVQAPNNKEGYVAANYVELEGGGPVAPPVTPTGPTSTASTPPGPLMVYISGSATSGLRMRSGPSVSHATLKVLAPNTALTVLEGTAEMVGVTGKWLKVSDPEGVEGFVAAWYVVMK